MAQRPRTLGLHDEMVPATPSSDEHTGTRERVATFHLGGIDDDEDLECEISDTVDDTILSIDEDAILSEFAGTAGSSTDSFRRRRARAMLVQSHTCSSSLDMPDLEESCGLERVEVENVRRPSAGRRRRTCGIPSMALTRSVSVCSFGKEQLLLPSFGGSLMHLRVRNKGCLITRKCVV